MKSLRPGARKLYFVEIPALVIWTGSLAWATFFYGGVLPRETFVLQMAGLVLFGLALLSHVLDPHGARIGPRWTLWWPFLLFLGFVGFTLVPLPANLHRLIAPWNAEIWSLAEPGLFRQIFADAGVEPVAGVRRILSEGPALSRPLSIVPELTRAHLIGGIAWLLALVGIIHILRRPAFFRVFLVVTVSLAMVQAAVGLVFYWTGRAVWPGPERATMQGASGTFYNRNHFVDFLGMTLPLAIVLWLDLWEEIRRRLPRNFWGKIRGILNAASGLFPLMALGLVALMLGVGYSLSRGGIAATLVVLASMTLFPPPVGPRRGSRDSPSNWHRLLRPTLVAVMLGVGVVLWLGPEPILERFGQTPRELEVRQNRLRAWQDSLRLFARTPFWGTGWGTYGDAFYRVQSFDAKVRWGHAHNEYLEVVTETGVLGLLLLGLGFSQIARYLRRVRPDHPKLLLYRYGALMGLFYVALDSFVDFDLHIPANAMLAVGLTGIALASSRPTLQKIDPTSTRHRGRCLLVLGLFIGLGFLYVYIAWNQYRSGAWEERLRVTDRGFPRVSAATIRQALAMLDNGRGTGRMYQALGIHLARYPGREDYALQAWTRAALANPQDYVSRHNMAQLLWHTYRFYYWSRDMFEQALTAAPAEAELWFQRGLFDLSWGKLNEAITAFRRCAELRSSFLGQIYPLVATMGGKELLRDVTPPQARSMLLDYLLKRGDHAAARAVLQELIEARDVATLRAFMPRVVAIPQMAVDEALLSELPAELLRSPEAGVWRLVARLVQGKRKDIAPEVQRVLAEVDRGYGKKSAAAARVRRQLAEFLIAAGFRETARSLYLELILLQPHARDLYLQLARLDKEAGRYDDAYRWLREAPVSDETRRDLWDLGRRALQARDQQLAREIFSFMARKRAYRDYGYYGLGMLAWNEKDPFGAYEYASRAASAAPRNFEFARAAARWAQAAGNWQAANSWWQKVVRLRPDTVEAYRALVEIARRSGDEAARRDWCQQVRMRGITWNGWERACGDVQGGNP